MPYKNKEDLYANQTKRWIDRKKQAVQYMGGSCKYCGYSNYYGALEFHHKDPSKKEVNWSKLRLRSWVKIYAELDKCILLCSNCHKEEHHRLRQNRVYGETGDHTGLLNL